MTKTIELQGKSPKYQQEYAENDFQIEKKSLFTHFRCYCQDDTFMEKFYNFFGAMRCVLPGEKTPNATFAAPVRLRLVSKIHKKLIEFFH